MIDEIKIELEQLTESGRLRECSAAIQEADSYILISGKKLLDFTSWDVFRLRSNPKVKRAVQSEIERSGLGASSPRLESGTSEVHLRCEKRLAQFFGCDDALLFSSRNQAVLSLFTALCSERDLLLLDDSLSSPVGDAGYLVNSSVSTFPAHNASALAKELERSAQFRKRYVVVDSVSAQSGEVLALGDILKVVKQFDAELIVDESYALGMLGARGAGGTEFFGLGPRDYSVFADLSLALGGSGACVAGSNLLITYLLNRSYTFRNETALPGALSAGCIQALDLLELMPSERKYVNSLAQKLSKNLSRMGLGCVEDANTPLVCFRMKKFSLIQEMRSALFQKGYFTEALLDDKPFSQGGVLRIIVNTSHKDEQIDEVSQAISEVYAKLDAG